MKYLEGYDKAKLLGIAHEQYIRDTEQNKGGNYDVNNTTKYNYPLKKHPEKEEYILEIADETLLDNEYQSILKQEKDLDKKYFEKEDKEGIKDETKK